MNRKLFRAALACGAALFVTGAMAADLPSAAPAPAPYIPPPPPVFTWTGFYVGANAGVAWENQNPTFVPGGIPGGATSLNPAVGNSNAGFTGGGQIGYNFQINQLVYGVEGDVDYLHDNNLNGTFVAPAFYNTAAGAASTYTLSGSRTSQVYGTIRGRLGWAWDRFLVYATGGAAFGGTNAPNSIAFTNGAAGCVAATGNCTFTRNSGNSVGAVVGGGVEYAFTPNWIAGVEYLHTFYGHFTFQNASGQTFTTANNNFDNNIVRVKLDYKF